MPLSGGARRRSRQLARQRRGVQKQEPTRIEKKGNGWEVDGRVTLAELAPLGVDSDASRRSESLGALVMARLKRLPRVGDKVDLGEVTAEVVHVARRRITRVHVEPKAHEQVE